MNIVIIGSDLTSISIAKMLADRHNVTLMIREKEREGILSGQGFSVFVGDIRNMNPMEPPLRNADVVVFTEDADVDMLSRFKSSRSDLYVIAVAPDIAVASALGRARLDLVLNVSNITGNAVAQSVQNLSTKQQVRKLVDMVRKSQRPVGIFLHNNPDPDAIASGMAFKLICQKLGAKANIFYGGEIGHQSNKTMVNLLGIDMFQVKDPDKVLDIVNSLGLTVLVDIHTPGANNVLLKDMVPNIVIDHHSTEAQVKGDLVDVEGVGATSSIMVKYLQMLGIVPDSTLSTALLYGIRSDTKDLTNGVSQLDLSAASYLNPLANHVLLESIEKPPVAKITMDAMAKAVQNKRIEGAYLVSCVEYITDRDVLPQAADFLLNLEGISTVLVFGIMDSTLHLSARSRDPRINVADVLRKAFGNIGSAGGHSTAAAGQIPLGILNGVENKDTVLNIMSEAVRKRFFETVSAIRIE